MAEKSNPPPSGGRGGRGSLILKAIQAASRQPGTKLPSKSSGSSLGSQEARSSGYDSQLVGSSAPESSENASTKSKSSGGRGVMLAKYILQHQAKSTSEEPTPLGRGSKGRGSILQALAKDLPIGSDGSETKSLTEELSRVTLSSEESDSPTIRQGTSGVKFQASSNWIRLAVDPEKVVFEYAVQFRPSVDAKNLRIQLLNSQKDKIGNVKSFDGAKLWLPLMLPQEVTQLTAQSRHTGEEINIIITYKNRTSFSNSVQLYNVLFNRVMKVLKLVMVGRSYFSPASSILVPQHQLEIWPGYVTAAHHMEGGVMLCVDVSHKVLRTATVYQIMGEIARFQTANFQQAAIKALVGTVVLTRYNNKSYRIDDIVFDINPQSTFKSSRDEEISYIDYYKNAYNIQICDRNQPLLLHKVKKKDLKDMGAVKMICLIPELCYMTGLTDEMRSDFRVMKDLAQYTRLTPNARQACLRKFIRNVNDNPEANQVLADWGLTLLDDAIQVEGRIVTSEPIIFGSRQIEGTQNTDWGRESCREKVLRPIDIKAGLWIVLYAFRDESKARKFVEILREVTNYMGIFVGNPKMIRLPNDNTDTYVNNLRENYHEKLQLAVIIFPTQREDRYSAVKRLSCSELGFPTQCIIARTISQEPKLRSITQKIALQINCKLGGELWALKIPMTGLMVCGIDVYHDLVNKGNSVVGFVASLNDSLTRWFSQALFQRPGDEIVHCIKMALLEALRRYYEERHNLPRSIFIYRDGVSDGMLKLTKEHEIPQITSIFNNFESYEPKFYFVVVQKRINTRIFASQSGRGMENPPPGSVIDHTITKRHWYDFLLVSQHVRQGTVTPTHYVVVHDAGGLKPEHVQRLTYKLTHLYYNWPGTIRVPAPCQYSHKLAYLVGQNVRKQPHSILQDKLYYL